MPERKGTYVHKKRIQHHPIVAAFALKLRTLRSERGLSQQALAVRAHVNVGYVGRLERGEAAPGLDLLARLAETLGVEPVRLIEGAGGMVSMAELEQELRAKMQRLLGRHDQAAVRSLGVVVGLMDNALARRRT
jgi:transcriptional regulator with XRE-family HTH domain